MSKNASDKEFLKYSEKFSLPSLLNKRWFLTSIPLSLVFSILTLITEVVPNNDFDSPAKIIGYLIATFIFAVIALPFIYIIGLAALAIFNITTLAILLIKFGAKRKQKSNVVVGLIILALVLFAFIYATLQTFGKN